MPAYTRNVRRLARLPSGVTIETTIHIYGHGAETTRSLSETNGPVVYIQAAQHGREINGTAVLRRVHEELLDTKLNGTVIAVPIANPVTFDRVSYTTPEAIDSVNNNMNRVWPGDDDGTVHERMAATLWEYIEAADAVIDLHTGSRDMLTHVVFMEDHAPSHRLAKAFGTDLHLAEAAGDAARDEWQDRDFAGKLRVAVAQADQPAITPELAHNRELVGSAIETGTMGTLNVLRELDVLSSVPIDTGDAVLARNHLGRVTVPESGLFHANPALSVGDTLSEGERLGVLFDPGTYEQLHVPKADRDGILYSLSREATVTAGSTVGRVAERVATTD